MQTAPLLDATYLKSNVASPKRKAWKNLEKSWVFNVLTVAFVYLALPTPANYFRGSMGFLMLCTLAAFLALAKKSLHRMVPLVQQGISSNKLLVFFLSWHSAGLIANLFVRGNGLADWRFMVSPFTLWLGLAFAFVFLYSPACQRRFRITMTLAIGMQGLVSARELLTGAGIAREMWIQLQGSWMFGNQSTYALWAMLLPVLFWQASCERGFLKVALIFACFAMLYVIMICSFATPISLVFIAGITFALLSAALRIRKDILTRLSAGVLIILAIALCYHVIMTHSFFGEISYRLSNFLRDPTTWGYTGGDLHESRWYRAQISINSFFTEPFFGIGGARHYNPGLGGHSSFFDLPALSGILGGGFALAGMVAVMLSTTATRLWRDRKIESLVSFIAVLTLAIAGIVNLNWEGQEPILLLIVSRAFRVLDPAAARKID